MRLPINRVAGVLSIAGFAAVLLSVDWHLGLIAIACAPLVFITAARYTRLTRAAAEGALAGFVSESLHGIRTIHAFGRRPSPRRLRGHRDLPAYPRAGPSPLGDTCPRA
ncbi:ABC transporter transmembrane domain-containing protein [Amycolatopsis sp. NPDC005232]|uniref:ABC transporter transmembrane domain-containing protein n=1 Tax=Amycolatopsis sp. NPDC005232 TaxID=3157027 RepID=UPI0033A1CA89